MAGYSESAVCSVWQQHISCRYICILKHVLVALCCIFQVYKPALVMLFEMWRTSCLSRFSVHCQLLVRCQLLQGPRWLRAMRVVPRKCQRSCRYSTHTLALCKGDVHFQLTGHMHVCRIAEPGPVHLPQRHMAGHCKSPVRKMWQQHISCRYA